MNIRELKQIHRYREQTGGCHGEGWGRKIKGQDIKMHEVLCTKSIRCKDIIYNTGKYNHYYNFKWNII